jgi:hypothetical protein
VLLVAFYSLKVEARVRLPQKSLMDYKVGDKVWYIPGFRLDGLLAIQCTITEVDDTFRQREAQAYLFYWIDEPVGHSLDEDNFFQTKEDAARELLSRREQLLKYYERENVVENAQLEKYRAKMIQFIMSTWPPGEKTWPETYPDKEWFNLEDIDNGKL